MLACILIISRPGLLAISISLYILYCSPIVETVIRREAVGGAMAGHIFRSFAILVSADLDIGYSPGYTKSDMRFLILLLCFLVTMSPASAADDLFADQGLFTDDSFFNDKKGGKADNTPVVEAQMERISAKRSFYQAWEDADAQLFQQMRQVGNWVNDWILMNHRFAEIGEQTEFARTQMDNLLPNNPYKYGAASQTAGLNPVSISDSPYDPLPPPRDPTNPHRVNIVLNYGMTSVDIDEWSEKAPDEWRAPPGEITMITNDQYLFCVWGAGADGRPIKDPLTRRTRLCVGNYQRFDNPAMDLQVD